MSLTHDIARAAWLADRRRGIGASEVAAVLGVDPTRSPWSVWAAKVDALAPDDGEDADTRRGRHLERGILAWYGEEHGVHVEPWDQTVSAPHPEGYPLRATPDGLAYTDFSAAGAGEAPIYVVEVKAPRRADGWDVDDGEGYPFRYEWQVRAQLAVLGLDEGRLVALLHGELRSWTVRRDLDVERRMLDRLAAWWGRHVDGGEPPPVDGSPDCRDWLVRRPRPVSRRATPEEAAWVAERARLAAEVKATESAIDLLDARILESAGDVGILDAPGWRLSVSDRKGSPRWKSIAEALAPGGVPADLVTAHTYSPTRYLGWRAMKEKA